jgi:hypothetical protein
MPQHSKRYDEEKCEQDVDHERGENVLIFYVRIHAREVILIEARRGHYVAVASRRHYFYSFESKCTSFEQGIKVSFQAARIFFLSSLYILWEKRAFDDGVLCICSCTYASD